MRGGTGMSEQAGAERFIDTVLYILKTNSSKQIKEIRGKIEICFRAMPKYAYNASAQQEALRSLLRSIVNGEELSSEQKQILDLHFVEKRFLRPVQEYFLKYLLMDLVYSVYDFAPSREVFEQYVKYIDKVANFLNEY